MIINKLKVAYAFILSLLMIFGRVMAEEIHFGNDTYALKYSALSPAMKGYINEYYKNNENSDNFSKSIGIYYYPEESNPLKLAEEFDKTVEASENSVLMKLIENKKQDKALLSFLVNNSINNNKFFEYNVYKYEKHPTKGVMVLKYSARYPFQSNDEITSIGNKVRDEEDGLLTMLATSPIPPIVEKDLVEGQ